jgi:hypothetical protein
VIVVSNSSPLITLARIGRLDLLLPPNILSAQALMAAEAMPCATSAFRI